jgi:cobalt-zinc-cadmium efflux system protein
MAHRRKPLGLALGLNTGVLLLEAVGGLAGNSLTLLMDAVHNLSDELGLLFLFLAYALWSGLSGHFLRSANLFNSVGLVAISALLIWQAVDRLSTPQPVSGLLPIVVGLLPADNLRGPHSNSMGSSDLLDGAQKEHEVKQ